MNTKFTPGPWVVKANTSFFDIGKPCKFSYNGIYETVCIGVMFEQEANAHLIACAPDMYAEIKQDIECLTRWIDNHGDAFPMTAAWKDMRANKIELLKRAKGEHE